MKTRRGKLKNGLSEIIDKEKLEQVLVLVDEYEKDNLATIDKLNRKRIVDLKRIKGGIKQAFHAHPILTKEMTGSIAKRVYGAMLENKGEENKLFSIFRKLKDKWL